MIHASPERIAACRARGWWGTETFDDLLEANVARAPAREALVDPPNREKVIGGAPQRLSWGELGRRVDGLATGLLEAGLRKDEIVLVQMANTWELFALYLACFRIGVIVSPVPAQYREHELDYVLEKTNAAAIAVHDRIGSHSHSRMALELARRHHTVRKVFVAGASGSLPEGTVDLTALATTGGAVERPDDRTTAGLVSADDAATLLWTSGSEGRPKGVLRSHAQWLVSREAVGPACGVGDGARLLSARPQVTHGAFVGSIVPWLVHAATLVNHHPFSLPLFVEQLRQEKIDFTSLAPAILVSLLSDPALLDGVDFTRLRYVSSGSAPLSPRHVTDFAERFGVQVINMFGSTEGAALVSSPRDVSDPAMRASLFPRLGVAGHRWQDPLDKLVETRLIDPESCQPIDEPGRPGEMCYRGPTVFDGYFDDPELTRAALDADGFYRSGDLFEITGDAQQFYRFVGRAKDIIVRGGFNISAQELERLLQSHPAIAEAAAVGFPDERLGERVCAVIVARPGATPPTLDTVNAFLRDEKQVAVIKLPERLIVLDALPRNANTKVDKGALRQLAATT